ncbi:MAG TPA: C4-type zinc ribbon domain-containing protein [Candidatus Brocadiia bacterium]|nr:C4-type zinc ribbon domain-containing protein [Candidatus Brocadiia bacterium]
MNEKLKPLIDYQNLVLKLQDLMAERQGCAEEEQAAQQILDMAKKRLEEKQQQLKKEQAATGGRDSELASIESKIAQLKAKLNTIRKQAEYDAVCTEIRGHNADKSKIEDEILVAMTNVEMTQAEIKSIKEEIKAAETNIGEIRKHTEGIKQELDAQIEAQKSRCEHQKAKVSHDAIKQFERLSSHHGAKALVPVSRKQDVGPKSPMHFICRGCNTKVTLQQVNVLMRGDTLVFCSSCGRIQYLEESEEE